MFAVFDLPLLRVCLIYFLLPYVVKAASVQAMVGYA